MVRLPDDILRPRDTSEEAWEVYLDILRKMTPEQRMMRAFRLTDTMRDVAMSGIRQRHPEYDDSQVRMALLGITMSKEQWRQHFGDMEVQP
jgi:hypothetical protein